MPQPVRRALVILDLLSHQGAPSKDLFRLVTSVLEARLVEADGLYVFADLSALACALPAAS
jgi:hypothetical protein